MDHKQYIDRAIKILTQKKNLDEESIYTMCNDLYLLLLKYFDSKNSEEVKLSACRYDIQYLIPIIEKRIKVSKEEFMAKYYSLWQQAYAFAGRRSLEHFVDYMEWDMPKKVLSSRRDVLKPLVYYLNKISFDSKLQYVVASYPPSYGKSYTLNCFTAWLYGLDIQNSVLRMSYAEELVLGFSRAVQGIILNPRYKEVFPQFKVYGDKPFEKEKESDWILKGKELNTLPSHLARTRDGSVTGVRASKAIIFDDMTKGREEATKPEIHKKYYDSWKTDWYNRKTGPQTKYVFAGTMWSPEDILNRVRSDIEKNTEIVPSKRFKYVWEAEDGSAVFIMIPLLNEEEQSTCPDVMSTKEAIQLRDTTDPFLWSCVYQQSPIAPTGLEFAWDNLQTYEEIPANAENYCMAVLDPNRKGKDNACMPILRPCGDKHYLESCIFKQKAIRELYDEIIWNIVNYKIKKLIIEENTDESLKTVIAERLEKLHYTCQLVDKFSTQNKESRINAMRYDVITNIVFKAKKNIKPNTDYGRFMKNLTEYSFDYPNKHDDAPDGICMYASEIVLGKSKPSKPKAINRGSLGI